VQASRDVLKISEHQELEELPFLVANTAIQTRERAGHPFHDPEKRLACDQRELWWTKYAACKAGEEAELPGSLKKDDIADLSAEPLLLYLIVLSGYHRRPEHAGEVNRNAIYADLFQGVVERRHAGLQPLPATIELQADFSEVMELIATTAWYGDGRTASVEEIQRHCPKHLKSAIKPYLESDTGIARLIAAFYYQRTEPGGRRRDAIEFTHRSFGEYLTARRLVHMVEEINQELSKGSRHYDEGKALEEWFELTHHAAMDVDLLRFVRDEIRLRHAQAAAWQATLCGLLNLSIRDGMPVTLSGDVTFWVGEKHARNAEEALLAVMNACGLVTRKVSEPAWLQAVGAGELIHRLRLQRIFRGPGNYIALACLSYTDFHEQILCYQDLGGAELRGSDLRDADLRGANLRNTDLSEAKLTRADLSEANLAVAYLGGANFSGANFSGADLRLTYLGGADLSGLLLDDANLSKAHLRRANLRGAKLFAADLRGADLNGAIGDAETRLPDGADRPANWPPEEPEEDTDQPGTS
jgi:hypothetical protein